MAETKRLDIEGLRKAAHPDLLISVRADDEIILGRQELRKKKKKTGIFDLF